MASDDSEVLVDLRRSVRAVSLLMLPAMAMATGVTTYLLLDDRSQATRWQIASCMALLVYLGGQQKLWANYLRGFGQVRFASLLEGRSGGALTSAGQGLLVGMVLWLRPEWGLPAALGALAIGYAIPVLMAWHRVHRIWRHVDPRGAIWRDLSSAVRRYWKFASNMLGGYLNSTVEIWLAGLVLASTQLSLFSAAQRLSVLLAVPLVSLGVVFSPVVSRLVGRDDERLGRLLRTGATLAIGVTAVAWVPMLVAPGWALGIVYGSEFADAATILVLLTLGTFTGVWCGMSGTALTMSRHESVVAGAQWVAVLLRVGLGVASVKAFGVGGLGLSAASITGMLSLYLWLTARRRLGLWTHPTLHPGLRLLRQVDG